MLASRVEAKPSIQKIEKCRARENQKSHFTPQKIGSDPPYLICSAVAFSPGLHAFPTERALDPVFPIAVVPVLKPIIHGISVGTEVLCGFYDLPVFVREPTLHLPELLLILFFESLRRCEH